MNTHTQNQLLPDICTKEYMTYKYAKYVYMTKYENTVPVFCNL